MPRSVRSIWNQVWGDDLPAGVDLIMTDMAIHAGVRRSVMILQQTVGTSVDGIMDQRTLAAILAVDPSKACNTITMRQEAWAGHKDDGWGWMARVDARRLAGLGLIVG